MAREIAGVINNITETSPLDSNYLRHVMFLALVGISIVSALIFFCADGISKDKANNGDSNTYGGGCAAGCGGGGGGGCGA
ncbi:PREDICTED: uncharacterized protein LOC104821838 [Tarenaya hassleriana]|uniref:uncharacterized protein LOC104821838 n=1 Tax=Tarenaya hassleriana TaxID=28532 RepID=UPI00053C505B|nr:PREDICTED: uncharacterized protein LOC104821838 [Tarenaya hassleriana]